MTNMTWANTSGSATPTELPLQSYMVFPPGDVPAGNFVAPTFNGLDVPYQLDAATYWGDGSLKGGVLRCVHAAGLAGNTTVSVDIRKRIGSFNNSSAITTANITGSSDFKVRLTNVHTAQVGTSGSTGPGNSGTNLLGVTISGGVITGGKARFPTNMTLASTAVQDYGGSGTGGAVSVSAGTVTVTSPGSGYSFVGSGTFTASFNSAISAINSGGNFANGLGLYQYAKGPVCDAWMVRILLDKHLHATLFIERWKKSDGSFLAFKRYGVVGAAMFDLVNALRNYTYDMDIMDGSTVLRGAANGDSDFRTIVNFVGGSTGTFDANARGNWSANGTAFDAIVIQPTPSECDYRKRSRVIMPMKAVTPTTSVPTTPSAYETGSGDAGKQYYGRFTPFGNAGVRSGLGAGGSGNEENPMEEISSLVWMTFRATQITAARTWLNNLRIGAAHSMSFGQLGSAAYEPTTMRYPNVIPASVQSFSGMTPTRETTSLQSIASTGYSHPRIAGNGGTLNSWGADVNSTYHQICLTYGAYMYDGEQWQLMALTSAANTTLAGRAATGARRSILGSTTYYGIHANQTNNVRVQAWSQRTQGFSVSAQPPVWADGSQNVERDHLAYCTMRHYQYLVDLAPFIGNVTVGGSGGPFSKTTDLSNSGVWPENFSLSVGGANDFSVPFMEDYDFQVTVFLNWLHQGTALGTALSQRLSYLKNWYVKIWNSPTGHVLVMSYRLRTLNGPPPSAPLNPLTGFDINNPTLGTFPYGLNGSNSNSTMSATAGNSTFSLTQGGVGFPNGFNRALADGSRIRLTATDLAGSYAQVGNIPGGMSTTIWYYWLQGATPNVGKLCTGLNGSGLPDPATAATPTTSTSLTNFWVIPKGIPADQDSQWGISAYSYHAVKLGTLRLAKALGMTDDSNGNITLALANAEILGRAMGLTDSLYAAAPQYFWDPVVP